MARKQERRPGVDTDLGHRTIENKLIDRCGFSVADEISTGLSIYVANRLSQQKRGMVALNLRMYVVL